MHYDCRLPEGEPVWDLGSHFSGGLGSRTWVGAYFYCLRQYLKHVMMMMMVIPPEI